MAGAATDSGLVDTLTRIVGDRHVLTSDEATRRYREGFRCGAGPVLAVLRPGTLVEMWRVLQACVRADVSIIVQAANTGLTGGSTPDGDDYPSALVIVSTRRLSGLHLIDGGLQVLCLPGTTLYALERALAPLGREPHSVIGSSCIGSSVIGGICNNSGGALVQRGPAFTQLALYGQVGPDGELRLVNHLGIRLSGDAETILETVEAGHFLPDDVEKDPAKWAHDHAYRDQVRDVENGTPARFNADPRCLFEGSGCAGKLILFAVRLDTFPKEIGTATFYIGTNDPAELTAIRRAVLGAIEPLAIAGEYMHRNCFDFTAKYGKDTFIAVQRLGTDRLPLLFATKARVDALVRRLRFVRPGFSDRWMQRLGALFPRHLPHRLTEYRDRFEHYLMLKMPAAALAATRELLGSLFPSATGDWFECTEEEATKAFLHRFAAAGAAVRYRALHPDTVEDVVALDIALPRNATEWFEALPPELDAALEHKLYYGHFLCHVFHQDYVVRKGHNPLDVEHAMWTLLDARGAEYPAEHNVGHLYPAKPSLADFYRSLDPENRLNPGIGQTTKARGWREPQGAA